MIELQEREEQQGQEEKLTAERAAHSKLMKEANLDGVESLIDDMVRPPVMLPPATAVQYACPHQPQPWLAMSLH